MPRIGWSPNIVAARIMHRRDRTSEIMIMNREMRRQETVRREVPDLKKINRTGAIHAKEQMITVPHVLLAKRAQYPTLGTVDHLRRRRLEIADVE
jgi:hypothetical protein